MKPHGTASRYTYGCRCEGCRAAYSIYQKTHRHRPAGRETRTDAWEPIDGRLQVECWCHRNVVKVRVEHLRDGLTYSCGLPACNSLGETLPA